MRSMTLLRYDPVTRRIEGVARDYGNCWLTAVEMLGEDSFLGCDNERNLTLLQRSEEGERNKMRVVANFHVGEQVNCLQWGRLVLPDPQHSEGLIGPPLLWGGVNGTLGAVQPITEEAYKFFKRLEETLATEIPGVGSLKHAEWRAARLKNMKPGKPHTGFVDGDLCETYLDLSPSDAARVAGAMDMHVNDITKRVEDMARAIH